MVEAPAGLALLGLHTTPSVSSRGFSSVHLGRKRSLVFLPFLKRAQSYRIRAPHL